jgi:hypothetical protein
MASAFTTAVQDSLPPTLVLPTEWVTTYEDVDDQIAVVIPIASRSATSAQNV